MAKSSKTSPSYDPTPRVDGLFSCQVEQCSTCKWWRTPRRKRTCKDDKIITLRKRKVTGTPATHVCGDYTPKDDARCGECLYWQAERRPRKKEPCVNLSLQDDEGKARTARSSHCGYFMQMEPFDTVNNYNLRVNDQLVQLLDLHKHSEPVAFVIRPEPTTGLLVMWRPTGPGTGEWDVLPVELDNLDEGALALRQFVCPDRGDMNSEVAFAGKATLVCGPHDDDTVGSQSDRSRPRRFRGVKTTITKGLSKITLRVEALRRRVLEDVVAHEEPEEDTPDTKTTPGAGRVQDEPWGPEWADLIERMEILIGSEMSVGGAAVAVQRGYFRERTGSRLSTRDGRRLQRQLVAAFKKKKQ